jgi:hypothetical protein
MPFEIQLSDITNSTTASDGTGVFDVLTQSIVKHIEAQYDAGRLDGTDYANVYLGSIQSVLAESVRFVLSEKQSSEQAALIAQQILSETKQNEINGLLDLQKIRLEKETALIIRQESELALSGTLDRLFTTEKTLATTSGATDSTNKTTSDIALTSAQELKVDAEKILVDSQNSELSLNGVSQRLVNDSQISKSGSDKLLVDSQKSELELNGVSQRLVNTGQIDKILSDKLLIDAQESEIAANALSQRSVATSGITVDVAQVSKVGSEKVLVDSQNSELLLNGTSQRLVNTAQISKIVADEVLTGSQNSELLLNGTSQRLVNTSQISKVSNETLFLAEQITSESKNNETGGVIDLTKTKIQEDIDLTIAQTSTQFEQVLASQSDTTRRNALNAKEVLHKVKETELVTRQESELSLTGIEERLFTVQKTSSTAASTVDSTNKTAADVSLSTAQELKIGSEKTLVDSQNSEVAPNAVSQRSVDASQVSKLSTESTLLTSRNAETLAGTTRTDSESAQRILLMSAQTVGFKTDAKQKLMRQLFEGYAVNVTTSGEVTAPPNGSTGTALDNIANDILDDLSSDVNV